MDERDAISVAKAFIRFVKHDCDGTIVDNVTLKTGTGYASVTLNGSVVFGYDPLLDDLDLPKEFAVFVRRADSVEFGPDPSPDGLERITMVFRDR